MRLRSALNRRIPLVGYRKRYFVMQLGLRLLRMRPSICLYRGKRLYRVTVWPDGNDVDALATSFMCELNAYQVSRSTADVATTSGATARYQPIG